MCTGVVGEGVGISPIVVGECLGVFTSGVGEG